MSKFNDTIIYFVNGLGCYGLSEEQENVYKTWISSWGNVPQENIKYKCHKTSSALKCIVKTYFSSMPLQESNFVNNLADEITADISNTAYKNVLVLGHSFGGAIVNRIAEIFNTNYTQARSTIYNKLSMAAFGSIYIPAYNNIENINIINYLSNSDVAMKCNKMAPIEIEDMLITLYFPKLKNKNNIVCKLPIQKLQTKTIQLCLYDTQSGEPLCRTNGPSIVKWEEHKNYSFMMATILYFFRVSKKNGTSESYIKDVINVYNIPYIGIDNNPYLTIDKSIDDTTFISDFSSHNSIEDDELLSQSSDEPVLIEKAPIKSNEFGGNRKKSQKYRKSKKSKKSKKSRRSRRSRKYKK
jgi:hypothetical protein